MLTLAFGLGPALGLGFGFDFGRDFSLCFGLDFGLGQSHGLEFRISPRPFIWTLLWPRHLVLALVKLSRIFQILKYCFWNDKPAKINFDRTQAFHSLPCHNIIAFCPLFLEKY